jgi:hypothetical protein
VGTTGLFGHFFTISGCFGDFHVQGKI